MEKFHKLCDNQGPFVVIVVSKEHKKIFGAFTDISLKSGGGTVKG